MASALRPCRHWLVAVLTAVMMMPYAASAAYRIRSVNLAGATHLLLRDIAGYYGMTYGRSGDAVHLTSRYSRLLFTRDDRQALINGVKVSLSHAPVEWRQEVLISETDFRSLLDPILRSAALPRRHTVTIVLDPGHGGKDQGAASAQTLEKDVNLKVATQVAALLRQHGFRVYMTRSDDRRLGLSERIGMAAGLKADLFVSIHCNAVGSSSVSGIETFLLTPEGTTSTYSSSTKTAPTAGNAYDRENARLAYELQKQAVTAANAYDRGIKHANFVVLRDAPCPAALIEVGFLTHPAERQKLADPQYQQRLALGIAQGIAAFRNATQPK